MIEGPSLTRVISFCAMIHLEGKRLIYLKNRDKSLLGCAQAPAGEQSWLLSHRLRQGGLNSHMKLTAPSPWF